jgi:hypothetical protein
MKAYEEVDTTSGRIHKYKIQQMPLVVTPGNSYSTTITDC